MTFIDDVIEKLKAAQDDGAVECYAYEGEVTGIICVTATGKNVSVIDTEEPVR